MISRKRYLFNLTIFINLKQTHSLCNSLLTIKQVHKINDTLFKPSIPYVAGQKNKCNGAELKQFIKYWPFVANQIFGLIASMLRDHTAKVS